MKITIIGCGNMGRALALRLSKTSQLYFYDHTSGKAESFEKEGFGKAFKNLDEPIKLSDMVILAVKPQNLKEVAEKIRIGKGQMLVSILTGASLAVLKGYFPEAAIIRMMPSMAVAYGAGVIGMCTEEIEVKDRVTKTFESLGKLYWLPESKINALTSLTGSGPAFFFSIIESMIDAGIAMGFTAEESKNLVYPMLQGSLTLLESSNLHPAELKWQITSPQGTTIAGLRKFEESAIRAGIMNTFLAAYERANELTK